MVLSAVQGVSSVNNSSSQQQRTVHLVKKGDTIYGIAKKYGISADALCNANGIKLKDATKLQIGRKLIIPVAVKKSQPKTAVKPAHVQVAGAKEPVTSKPSEQQNGQRDYCRFKNDLASKESSSRTNVVNQFGYMGKYQMGKKALEEIGVYEPVEGEKQSKDYKGTFTGKFGITSTTNFLSNVSAQESAMDALQRAQWRQIQRRNLESYSNMDICYFDGVTTNSVHVTDSGMLAGAHLLGSGNLAKFLRSEGKTIPKDGNGVPITAYMKKFGGYNIEEVTR